MDICKRHWSSVWSFQAPDEQPWFLLTRDEPVKGVGVRHLSLSASCLESLREAWLEDDEKRSSKELKLKEAVDEFAAEALGRPMERWESEGGGYIYCRVRTLPEILTSAAQDVIEGAKEKIEEHLKFIWSEVCANAGRQGIWERNYVAADAGLTEKTGGTGEEDSETQYPPNAFLTYWGMRTLECAANRQLCDSDLFEQQRKIAQLWLQRSLAAQIALAIASSSERADPQQLCWALCGMLRYADREELKYPSNIDLVIASLEALFDQQHETGLWARGDALFHYPKSGNAYCFTYETLTELIRIAVEQRDPGELLRRSLRPYASDLFRAAEYAIANSENLGDSGLGWCSRHHPQRTKPESWATAATHAYLENLRCLIGLWTADSARRELRVRTPRWPEPDDAMPMLYNRGRSWRIDGWDAEELLAGLFLHPVISDSCPRSATRPGSSTDS